MVDLTGRTFGELLAIKPLTQREPSNRTVIWLCRCSCGRFHKVNSNNLQRGQVRSCGCLRRRRHEKY